MRDTAINPKIGIDNVVVAKLISDPGGTTPPTYGPVMQMRGAVQASVASNSSVETDYGDNGAIFVTNSRGNTDGTFEFTGCDPAILAELLGQERANGITIEKPMDQSPYFAVGYRLWISGSDDNGDEIYEYVWLAKGKFSVPDNGGTTKKETIDFQHVTLNAQFSQTAYSKDGKGNGVILSKCRTDMDTPASMVTNWFNQPVISTSQNLSAVEIDSAVKSSAKVITITGSKEDSSDFNFDLNSIELGETLLIQKEGLSIEGVVSVGENVSTIVFTAAENLANGDYIVVVTAGVKDNNGVAVTPYSGIVTVS